MLEKTGKALFIINSPFQSLCMFEAIEHFSLTDYDVILRPDTVEKNNEMLVGILTSKGIPYKIVRMNHIIKDILPHLFKKKKRYSSFYIGDYYSGGIVAYIYALIYARRKATITYLDDGTITLNIFQTPPVPRMHNRKIALVVKLYEIIKLLKGIKNPSFFTIFNVQSNKYKIEKNQFLSLRSSIDSLDNNGVYIIGTNFRNNREEFLELLSRIIHYVKNEYSGQSIYYCPHRRNLDNEALFKKLEDENVSLFDTKVSVEYDFVENRIRPYAIIAFGSTAVFTLKMIYPETDIYNVFFMIQDEGYKQEFSSQANDFGVRSLDNLID